jgi:hypothetical protein
MTPSFTVRKVVLSGSLFSLACASFIARFAPARDQILSPHERHQKADVDCGSCHESIFDATSLSTSNLPNEKKCLECHKEEKVEKKNCGFCHTRADAPLTFERHARTLKMNHAAHMERVKEDCRVCHRVLPNPLRTDGMAPSMDGCLTCHEHQEQFDEGRCDACHLDLTRYPIKPLSAFTHQGDFVKTHRLEANTQACATCHEQNFCADCHTKTTPMKPERFLSERVDRNFIHRADFIGRHAIEARSDQALCMRCHGTTYCSDCHARSGLTTASGRPLNPHPLGYAQGKQHGQEARRGISECAACHDQGAASNCVSCHKVGGIGGNPHEPAWLLRHGPGEIARNPMCVVCHSP